MDPVVGTLQTLFLVLSTTLQERHSCFAYFEAVWQLSGFELGSAATVAASRGSALLWPSGWLFQDDLTILLLQHPLRFFLPLPGRLCLPSAPSAHLPTIISDSRCCRYPKRLIA